jgi:uncharacterized iron-regulated membrane protein
MLASTTQPIDWTARLTLWGAIITAAITVATAVSLYALSQFKKIRDAVRDLRETTATNTTNIGTTASVTRGIAQAQAADPNTTLNVSDASVRAVDQIASTPEIAIESPGETSPVASVPNPQSQARAFNAANPDVT